MADVSIMVADDHEIVRQGLRLLLQNEPDFGVVAEVADGVEAVRHLEQAQPDVLVADLRMPGLDGLEVIRQAAHVSPQTRVIVYSMYADESYVLEALKLGAVGYVPKSAPTEELLRAIREAVAGRRYLSPPLSEHVISAYLRSAGASEPDPLDCLTRREREVMHLAAQGLTNAQIAESLAISARTAETHRGRMMRKLGLGSQAELGRLAGELGLLSSDHN